MELSSRQKPFRRTCKPLLQVPRSGSTGLRFARFETLADAWAAPVEDGYYISRITERRNEKIVVHFDADNQ